MDRMELMRKPAPQQTCARPGCTGKARMEVTHCPSCGAAFPVIAALDTGGDLLAEVQATIATLAQMERHRERMGSEPVQLALDVVADARRRLARRELFVCIVGEKKVGKSTFMNAILQQPLLSTAVRECTGTVTYIRFGKANDYRATLEDGSVETFDEAGQREQTRLAEMQSQLEERLRELHAAEKDLPAEHERLVHLSVRSDQELQNRTQEAAAANTAYEDLCRNLGLQQTEIADREVRLKAAGKDVPQQYRRPGHALEPWKWGLRYFTDKTAQPEWLAHLQQVKQLHADQATLETFRKQVQAALQIQREKQKTRDDTHARCQQVAADIASIAKRIHILPKTLATFQARWQETSTAATELRAAREEAFRNEIRHLTDQEKRGGQVHRLELWVPTQRISSDLVIIDTPGVNTDHETNRNRSWDAIRREADGCMVLSDIQQTVNKSTRDFVREVKKYLPHLMLVLTKVDKAVESAEFDGGSIEEQIDEARRFGEKRFAEEVGRAPNEILSFAVSAERALRNDDPVAAERFTQDITTITNLLRDDRTLIVATRCAKTIVTCQQQIGDALHQAEAAYASHIRALEANRIPDPTAFCQAKLRTLADDLDASATQLINLGLVALQQEYTNLRDECVAQIQRCTTSAELKKYLEPIQQNLATQVARINQRVQQMLAASASTGLRNLETPLLAELRERYNIVQRIAGSADVRIAASNLGLRGTAPAMSLQLATDVRSFETQQKAMWLGGAFTGALIGSAIPILGTAIGGVIGGVAGLLFGPSFEKVRDECAQQCAATLDAARSQALASFDASHPQIAQDLKGAVAGGLHAAVQQYGSWIDAIIRDEQARIAAERANLQHLVELQQRMGQHSQRLDTLMERAIGQSRGMSR